MKKKTAVTAAIIAALGLVIFAGAFAAAGFDISKLSTEVYMTNTYDIDGAFSSIDVSTMNTDVTFAVSADGSAKVVCEERDKVRHSVRVEDGTLLIHAEDERKWYDMISVFGKGLTMTVYLPAGSYEALNVVSHTGDVTVPAAFTFGKAGIEASTGDVSFAAAVDGPVSIAASTGDISLSSVRAGSAALRVSTGGIAAEKIECEGEFSAETKTGKTALSNVKCGSLIVKGSTGRVTLADTAARDSFDIETGTGDVRFDGCDAAAIDVRTSTGDVTGTLLTEKVFLCRTSTGKVRVPDTITGGRCAITTSTGDIEISLKD